MSGEHIGNILTKKRMTLLILSEKDFAGMVEKPEMMPLFI